MKCTTALLCLLFFSLGISAQKPDSTGINPDSLSSGFTEATGPFGVARDLSKLMGPNVAAFEKRGRVPVSYNTGQLNLSIPLMNLAVDDQLQIPVVLPYSSSGLKPADVPSSTGNGWTLPLGGTIVQYYKGIDDFSSAGMQNPYVKNLLDTYNNVSSWPGTEKYPYMWEVANQTMDSQFDVFSLNFGNRSNQFYFDKSEIKLFHQEQLRVTFASDVFTVTDEMGYQYIFGIKKLSTGNYTDHVMGGKIFTEGTTTWFLTKIITPNAQEVIFTYQDDITYEISERHTSYAMGQIVVAYECIDDLQYKPTYSNTDLTISQYLLKGVQYPAGKLEMQYIDRQDLQSPNGVKSKALSSIRQRNINNEVIRKAVFQYHYMPASQDRLMLSSVAVSGKDTTVSEVFAFDYYPSTVAVPIPGLTKPGVTNPQNNGVDFQNYFNGGFGNTDKVHRTIYPENHVFLSGPSPIVGGGDRNPDPLYSRMGMLRKITWPDKGYEEFFYEANTYQKTIGSLNIFDPANASTLYDIIMHLGSAHCDTVVQTFTIAANPDARIILNAEAKTEAITFRLKNTSSSSYLINSTYLPSEDMEQAFYVNLNAGTYQSEILAGCTSPGGFASAWVTIERPSTTEREIMTGGNRIMKIKRYPVTGRPDIRRISYKWGRETAPFENWHQRAIAYQPYMGNYCRECKPAFVVTSSSVYSFDGFHVEYREVDERSHLNGRSNYQYLNWPDTGDFPAVEDHRSRVAFPWRYGLLFNRTDLRKMDRISTIDINVYRPMVLPPWKDRGLLAKFRYSCPTAINYSPGALFSIFDTGVVPVFTDTTGLLRTSKSYHNDLSVMLHKDTTTYEYNARWQPYRVSKSRSDGGLTVETSYFVDDYANSASPNIATLKNKHIVGKPLKTITTINGSTAYGERATPNTNGNFFEVWGYESAGNHNHNPATLTGTDFTLQEVRTYNSKGKISGFTGRDGISYVYLWSYNFTHPVALVANATESEVSVIIGSTESFGALTNESSIAAALDTLRTSLTDANLTTALYYPGIGIKQLTNPDGMLFTYEYDGMNRLSTVKDRNGKVTDKYNYQNALTIVND
jgi:hypothetical protein